MTDNNNQTAGMPSQRGSLFVAFIGGALLGASAFWTWLELMPAGDSL